MDETVDTNVDTIANPTVDQEADPTFEETLYCANHPQTETLLRCNKCEKPICMKCAVLTDVGYRCKECIRGQQEVYFNAESMDNPIAFGVGFGVAAIAAPIVGLLISGFGFFGLIIAFIAGSSAGSILAQVIRRAVGRRRGRYLRYFAMAGVVLGVIFGNIAGLFFGLPFTLLTLSMLLFTGLALATAWQFLK